VPSTTATDDISQHDHAKQATKGSPCRFRVRFTLGFWDFVDQNCNFKPNYKKYRNRMRF